MAVPILETPRLILRGWRDDDIDPWAKMSADPSVMEFYPSVYDRQRSEQSAAYIRERLECDGFGLWAVELKATGHFAGMIGLNEITFDLPFSPPREVGWRLAHDVWGHGYAPEGAAAALAFAFDVLRWDEVVAITSRLNLRSQRVMQKLGMTRDPSDDFDHPNIEDGHRLKPHVLYRIRIEKRHG